MEETVAVLTENLSGMMSGEMIVFLISFLPVLELRGGMLAASFLGIDMWRAVFLCIVGNILPMPVILLTINQVFAWMRRVRLFEPLVNRLESSALARSEKIQKYEFWGLLLFVGIPLPGTGAWSGALIASLLRIRVTKALAALIGGILLAVLIMTLFSYGILGQIW